MSWFRQVAHVFLKDARATRWLLLAYAALLVLGVAEVVAGVRVAAMTVSLGSFVLQGTAAIIGASIILADSPFNPRAHWATLPLARSAVLAAKIMMVIVLLLLNGAAIAVALRAFGASPGELIRPAALAILPQFTLLVGTALIASVARSLRAVLIVLVAAVPAYFLFGWLTILFTRNGADIGLAHNTVVFVMTLVGLFSLLLLYRSRRLHVITRVGVIVAATLLLGSSSAVNRADAYGPAVRSPGMVVTATLAPADSAMRGTMSGVPLQLSLRMQGITATQRIEWRPSAVRVARSGGAGTESAILSAGYTLNNPVLPLPPSLHWGGAYPKQDAGEAVGDMARAWHPPLPASLGKQLTNDVTDVVIHGTVELREPHVFGRLPLTPNARFTQHGRRFTLLSASQREDAEVMVQFESVLNDSRDDLSHYTFVLVNDARAQAVRLRMAERASSDTDSWMLSPTFANRVTAKLLSTDHGITPAGWQQLNRTPVSFDDAWLPASELVIIEWVLVGSLPVHAQTSINSRASGPR